MRLGSTYDDYIGPRSEVYRGGVANLVYHFGTKLLMTKAHHPQSDG